MYSDIPVSFAQHLSVDELTNQDAPFKIKWSGKLSALLVAVLSVTGTDNRKRETHWLEETGN